jgi:3-deoxy-manno-octulosonate cytidylyltransferase (CMP-KDO synthetase)
MTPSDIPSGTDRCRVALEKLEEKPDFIVNIQGDEPFIAPDQINKVLDLLAKKDAEIATLICAAANQEEVENPNRVKVVTALDGKALYFSRYGIPYPRNEQTPDPGGYFIHLGLYGFTFDALIETGRQRVSFLEEKEGLEQLRWLENGMSIYTGITEMRTESVDTPEDLVAIEKKYFL